MPTSQTSSPSTSFLHEVQSGQPIPSEKIAYFEQRALNNFYAVVLTKFLQSGLRKADLARRIGLSQPQLNRYLASPGNWTIATVQRLLLGIAGEEALLNSKSFLGRTPQNRSVLDIMDDEDVSPLPRTEPTTSDSLSITLKFERLQPVDA